MSELIYLKDSEQLVFPQAMVGIAPGVPCRLEAQVVGGPIDPPRTSLRADAKAVTLHQFTLQQRGAGWHARVIIDI
jgi:SHS2 domain-containing protein